MASSSNPPTDTPADTTTTSTEDAPDSITFTVKTSKDERYTLNLPLTTPISEMKTKLAELSDVAVNRQRLIYSGRVMKDDDTLAFYKVKNGHTVHLVKGAASNQQATAARAPAVPRNIAAGSGNNPLAGLTGARYAGIGPPLPNASMFGADGGVCSPSSPY